MNSQKPRFAKSTEIKSPSTRYQGSKRKLLPWFYKVFDQYSFDSVLDLMSGSSSVSYLFKGMNKQVYANDILRFNYNSALAFIENNNRTISNSDLKFLLTKHRNIKYKDTIQKIYSGYYFNDSENKWLDMVICNVNYLFNNKIIDKYKKAMLMHSLSQACLMKRPFNLFHRKNLKLRKAKVSRSFGNKVTWETPFEELFVRLSDEANKYIFKNGKKNKAFNKDVLNFNNGNVDMVYIDPPYYTKEKNKESCNYTFIYHFLEGLSDYENWENNINKNCPIKSLNVTCNSYYDALYCGSSSHDKIKDWLNTVIMKWPNSMIAVSYKNEGQPSINQIKYCLKKTGRKVSISTTPYIYALNRGNNRCVNKEALIIGY